MDLCISNPIGFQNTPGVGFAQELIFIALLISRYRDPYG